MGSTALLRPPGAPLGPVIYRKLVKKCTQRPRRDQRSAPAANNWSRRDQLLPENEEHDGQAGARAGPSGSSYQCAPAQASQPRAAHAYQPGSILSRVRPWKRAESKGHAMPELPRWFRLTDGTLWGANRAPSRHGRRWMLLVAPAVGLALVTAACGGGSPNAGVASVGRTTTTTTTAARAGTVAAAARPPGGRLSSTPGVCARTASPAFLSRAISGRRMP